MIRQYRIVSFRGAIGAGKSTAAQFLVDNYKYTKIAFADALKLEVFAALYAGRNPGFTAYYNANPDNDCIFPVPSVDESVDPLSPPEARINWINKNKVALRPLLQWWGTEYRRSQSVNYWVYQWQARTVKALANGEYVVTDDARFDNELDLITMMGGKHLFIRTREDKIATRLVVRDGKVNAGIAGHASEGLVKANDPRNAAVLENNNDPLDLFEQIDYILHYGVNR